VPCQNSSIAADWHFALARRAGIQSSAARCCPGVLLQPGASRKVAEVSIHVECTNYGVIEDLHQAIMHALAQYFRHSRMSPDEISASVF
jgi:hypothetical protein